MTSVKDHKEALSAENMNHMLLDSRRSFARNSGSCCSHRRLG